MFSKIRGWGKDRNIIDGCSQAAQYEKLMEEVGELGRALIDQDERGFVDAIGDCVVVLTLLAAQGDYAIEECIESAWKQIKDRKGRLINGKFVKEQ